MASLGLIYIDVRFNTTMCFTFHRNGTPTWLAWLGSKHSLAWLASNLKLLTNLENMYRVVALETQFFQET